MNLIAAADQAWGIGRDGGLLTHLPGDMKYFRETTRGHVVVMGRKTLEGFPGGQPLSQRVNVVLSRDPGFRIKGAEVCKSLEAALQFLEQFPPEDIYIIGGKSIYEQFLPYCNTVHVTAIDYAYAGDTYFPDLDKEEEWEMEEEGEEQTYFSICYCFRRYRRKKAVVTGERKC